jgi:hypothetical protein
LAPPPGILCIWDWQVTRTGTLYRRRFASMTESRRSKQTSNSSSIMLPGRRRSWVMFYYLKDVYMSYFIREMVYTLYLNGLYKVETIQIFFEKKKAAAEATKENKE